MNKSATYFFFFSFVFAMGMLIVGSNEDENFHAGRSTVLAGYPGPGMVSKRTVADASGNMTLVIKIKDQAK